MGDEEIRDIEEGMGTEEKPQKGVSRRNFLKGAAIGAAGVAAGFATAGLLAGCAPKAQNQAAPGGAGKASWETPPAPISDSQIKKTIIADVIVLGAGVAGFVSATSAMDAGAKVIVLEKHTTSRVGGGFNGALGTKMQKKLGIEIDKEIIFKKLMIQTEAQIDQGLLRLWIDHSGEILDWLLDKTDAAGIKTGILQWPTPPGWNRDREIWGIYPTAHNIGVDQGDTQLPLLNLLRDGLLKGGAEIHFSTPAVQLIRQNNGRVTGAIAKNANGDYIKYTAKAVIVCTGDFGNDPEMMNRYCPTKMAELARDANIYTSYMKEQPAQKLDVGDGHKMCMWVGAWMEDAPHATISWATSPLNWCLASFLKVNTNGERYENEDTGLMYLPQTILKQPGGISWQIFDAKYEEDFKKQGVFDLFGALPINDEIRASVEQRCLKANTLDELAQKMKVPVDAFKASVARRNELTKLGSDPDFGLFPERLTTIEKPPFYAGKVMSGFACSLGGIRVNTKLQALDKDGKVIPGLYLAGNTVGMRYGLYYSAVTPGISNGYAFTHGYFAGKHAAAERA